MASRSRSKSSVVLELGTGLLPPVPKVDHAFLESVAKDPDVVDWLISVSDKEGTRSDYLTSLSRFLKWTGWKPADIFTFKPEAMREGEPQCEVEAQFKRFHESLRKMGYAGLTRAQATAALYSFLGSKGYTVKRRLVRLDMSCKLEMRVPSQEEVQIFLEYAKGIKKKLLYTLMTETQHN